MMDTAPTMSLRTRKFITPKTIKGSCMVGEPDELIAAIRQAEQAGPSGDFSFATAQNKP